MKYRNYKPICKPKTKHENSNQNRIFSFVKTKKQAIFLFLVISFQIGNEMIKTYSFHTFLLY